MFDFSRLIGALPEGRHSPQHPWRKVFEAVFLGAAMQMPSLLQIEAECRGGALAKRIGPISDDTIGYALQRQAPEPVFTLTRIKRPLQPPTVLPFGTNSRQVSALPPNPPPVYGIAGVVPRRHEAKQASVV